MFEQYSYKERQVAKDKHKNYSFAPLNLIFIFPFCNWKTDTLITALVQGYFDFYWRSQRFQQHSFLININGADA